MKKLWILISLLFAFLIANAQQIDGVYETDFKDMTLTQNGSKVTGTYKHMDGRIDATISGNILTGWWYQSNGKGKLSFTFDEDFSAFTGKWSYNDAEPKSKWNGIKKNVPTSVKIGIEGVYTSDFKDMTLVQNGNKVTGTYKHMDGRIDATLNGNVLTGWWYQSNGKGRMVFVFNDDFTAFTGKWSYNDGEPKSKWNGEKKYKPVQTVGKIDGTYNTDFKEMTISSNGNKVTGTYKHANGRIEGILNGNILTGWWYQSNGKGRLVFVFNADFSAFTGKWGYNDTDPKSKWDGKRK